LFIGDKKYLEGARYLISAFAVLKKNDPDLVLDIVAMRKEDFDYLPEGVTCHGYLNKGVDKDRKLLYSLIEDAKVFVNTTPKIGSFSASLEALYFYTPVIVTPYEDFVKTFGSEINFGYICENHSIDLLCSKIINIFNDPDYDKFCFAAHEAVKNFTWSYRVDQMLEKIKTLT